MKQNLSFQPKAIVQGILLASLSMQADAQTCNANVVSSTPSVDFVQHGDGTVTHIPTNLMWKVCPEGLDWDSGSCVIPAGATAQLARQDEIDDAIGNIDTSRDVLKKVLKKSQEVQGLLFELWQITEDVKTSSNFDDFKVADEEYQQLVNEIHRISNETEHSGSFLMNDNSYSAMPTNSVRDAEGLGWAAVQNIYTAYQVDTTWSTKTSTLHIPLMDFTTLTAVQSTVNLYVNSTDISANRVNATQAGVNAMSSFSVIQILRSRWEIVKGQMNIAMSNLESDENNVLNDSLNTFTWEQALQQADGVNSGSGYASYNDWRVPNLKELQSIQEVKCSQPAVNSRIFPKKDRTFWTSSIRTIFNNNEAWKVDLYTGHSQVGDRTGILNLVLVRDAKPVDPALALLAHYNFDAQDAADNSGNGHTGTVYGSTYEDGIANKAVVFDGSDDYIEIDGSSGWLPKGSEQRTVTYWFKYDTVPTGSEHLVGWGASDPQKKFAIKSNSNQKPSIDSLGSNSAVANFDIDTRWRHIAMAYYGRGDVRFYIDGKAVEGSSRFGKYLSTEANTNLVFGKNPTAASSYYSGKLDDVRIFNRALNEAEILFEYENSLPFPVVVSPVTGRTWMAYNLGATEACTDTNADGDPENPVNCLGDFYQWGRKSDNHETVSWSSYTTNSISTSSGTRLPNSYVSDDFIVVLMGDTDWADTGSWTNADEDRANFWEAADGTGVCPAGFRVPTKEEWQAETQITNRNSAMASRLKLTHHGWRGYNGAFDHADDHTYYWTQESDSVNNAYAYKIDASSATAIPMGKAHAMPVRCIKDEPIPPPAT